MRRLQRVRQVRLPIVEVWGASTTSAAPCTRSDRSGRTQRGVDSIVMEGPAEIQRIRVWRSCLAAIDLRIDPAGVPLQYSTPEHCDVLLDREIGDQRQRRGSSGSG